MDEIKNVFKKNDNEIFSSKKDKIRDIKSKLLSDNLKNPIKRRARRLSINSKGEMLSRSISMKNYKGPRAQRPVKSGDFFGSFIKKIQKDNKNAIRAKSNFLKLNFSLPKIPNIIKNIINPKKDEQTQKKGINKELLKKPCPNGKIRNLETERCVNIEPNIKKYPKKSDLKEKDFESLLNLIKNVKKAKI